MLSALPALIENHLEWWIAGAIVIVGLFIYGGKDLLRFSPRRAWAISGVCFDESIRRRVLWITPLAMIGVLLVCELQRPSDEQDVIRQTIKFSLFAVGLVVTITAIILACTNLPKEIETRVIYTIVTKPITRLEIVFGKVLGFAKVSLAIVVVMGLFTFGYLHVRAWSLRKDIQQRLDSGSIDQVSLPTYEYWSQAGLLNARTLDGPDELQVFSRMPKAGDTRRWFFGSEQGQMVVPFRITEAQLVPDGAPGAAPGAAGLVVRLLIGFDRSNLRDPRSPEDEAQDAAGDLPIGIRAPDAPAATKPTGPPKSAQIGVEFLDRNLESLIDARLVSNGQPIVLTDPTGQTPVGVRITPEQAQTLLSAQLFYVSIVGLSRGTEYSVDTRHEPEPLKNPVSLVVPPGNPNARGKVIGPVHDGSGPQYQPALPSFRSRGAMFGQQLRGGPEGEAPVMLYKFRKSPTDSRTSNASFEIEAAVERNIEAEDEAEPTKLELQVVNRDNGQSSQRIYVYPENNRTAHFYVPREFTAGGNFDVFIRNLSIGQYVTFQPDSIELVTSTASFDVNLAKSLLIIWMLSILVVVIAIFCSLFLSWPIAIVLTLVLLLGHWGVLQLGDTLAPGIGNSVATDFGFQDASKNKVVSDSVEAMSRLLRNFSRILPDIQQFSAIEEIEKGLTIPLSRLLDSLLVLATFGVPLVVLSYVLLRRKEVAP